MDTHEAQLPPEQAWPAGIAQEAAARVSEAGASLRPECVRLGNRGCRAGGKGQASLGPHALPSVDLRGSVRVG